MLIIDTFINVFYNGKCVYYITYGEYVKGGKKMNKTKLGISTNMLAVITFLIAISIEFVSSSYLLSMGFVVLAAYILYKEEDIWLKSCVIKAILIMLVFSLVPFFLSFIDDIIKLMIQQIHQFLFAVC